MRIKSLLVGLAALSALGLASPPASATHRAEPEGWDRMRVIRHWVYRPHFAHVYHTRTDVDPYAYRFEPRGYYPYYNSGYWVPSGVYKRPRYAYKLPKYYQAWGYPKYGYDNVEWHNRKYGRIRLGHW